MAANAEGKLEQSWYGDSSWSLILLPFSWLFQCLSYFRKKIQIAQSKKIVDIPVVIVGNIAVGGTGKTPLIIALAKECRQRGLKPGIISRGYGSKAPHYPFSVNESASPIESGDEPLLIAQATGCPVVISPDRNQALKALVEQYDCNIVLSDDGLQHYQLARDIEIAVIDGSRGLGNGHCLPAGPLRESPTRLQSVDMVVVNGVLQRKQNIPACFQTMSLKTGLWRRVVDDKAGKLETLSALDKVNAVTGIGNPERFFRSLQESNIELIKYSYDDHHNFQLSDIVFNNKLPVVMTAKDAVKCKPILINSQLSSDEKNAYWYLPVEAQLPDEFYSKLFSKLSVIAEN